MKRMTPAVLGGVVAGLLATAALAQNLSPKEQIDARVKVQTAVALWEIAEAEGDGEAMLVAGRLLSAVGPVERRDSAGDKPQFYSVGDIAAAARALGVEAGKADALASSANAETSERGYCYWDYECLGSGTFECGWIYVCN